MSCHVPADHCAKTNRADIICRAVVHVLSQKILIYGNIEQALVTTVQEGVL